MAQFHAPRRLLVGFSLLVGALAFAGPAHAVAPTGTLQSSSISTPANQAYLFNASGSQTFTVSGNATVTGGNGQAAVDVDCSLYSGSSYSTVTAMSGTVGNGSFTLTVPMSPLYNQTCVLRLVPTTAHDANGNGSLPANPAPFTGPNIAVSTYSDSQGKVADGPNTGKLYDYLISGQGFTGQLDGYGLHSAGSFTLQGLGAFQASPAVDNGTVPVFQTAGWFNTAALAGDKSEIVVDAKNAYAPAGAQGLYGRTNNLTFDGSIDATHFQPLQITGPPTVDPSTGKTTITEVDPLVRCATPNPGDPDPGPNGAPTNPAGHANCPDFASTGVELVRSVTYDHDGAQIVLDDSFQSTDNLPHTVSLRYFEGQFPPNYLGSDAATLYRFAWVDSAYKLYHGGDAVGASPSGINTVYVAPNGGNALGTATGYPYARGALTFSAPTDGIQFYSGDEYEYERQYLNRTVLPTGGLKIKSVYSVANSQSALDALVADAHAAINPTTPPPNKNPGSNNNPGAHQTPGAHHPVPVITALSEFRRCVRAPRLKQPTASEKGLAFSFDLSEAANVSFVLKRRNGSPLWATCPPHRGASHHTYTEQAHITRPGAQGHNTTSLATTARHVGSRPPYSERPLKAGSRRVSLSDIVKGQRLKPGTYVLYVQATDAFGQASNIAHIKFWVLKRRHH